MFFEKLTNKNLDNLEFFGFKVTNFKLEDDSIYIELDNGSYKFFAKDFYVKGGNPKSLLVIDKFQNVWREFMLVTFGESYANALKNRRKPIENQ